ncbi:heme ABC transporter ATP-binding protein, partial [Streptococcus suis]
RHLGYSFEGDKPLSSLDKLDLSQVQFEKAYAETKPEPKEVILSAENLEFGYDENHLILKGISFDLHKGEKVAIVG